MTNIERIKTLTEELSRQESKDCTIKEEALSCLVKMKEMLCKPRMNKKVLIVEIESLISKLS